MGGAGSLRATSASERGLEPAVAAGTERHEVRRVVSAAFGARNDVMGTEKVLATALAACAIALDNESGELPPT